jgi:hypothetical protein
MLPWTLTMAAGSLQEWTLTLASGSGPYPVSGATWEYVARPSAADMSAPPLIDITTTATPAGLITVTSTGSLSQLLLVICPAATAALLGCYSHALWMNPGTPSALEVAGGSLLVVAAPQP